MGKSPPLLIMTDTNYSENLSQGYSNVTTIYVLNNGELIHSPEAYQQVENLFSWVDKRDIITRLLRLRRETESHNKSYIFIYENGRRIREHNNVPENVNPALLVEHQV